ncbi:MAG: glycosyltransferase family 2 protein [Methylococcaceae bacterium]|nr:glycosyltransferase family 2 protein [Methylococcaceae bacterium]
MKYSVVIPCYNSAQYLGDQLDGLAKQRLAEPWEVIVVDNGSNDDPGSVVRAFQSKVPNLRMIDASGGRGVSYARNRGAEAATGEFLLFCDADDVVAPGWLEAMARAFAHYDLLTGVAEYDKLNVNPGVRQEPRTSARVWDFLPLMPHAIGCNMGIRKSLHEAIGGCDETLFAMDDVDYSWRAQLAGAELHFVADAVVHYRVRNSLWVAFKQFMRYGEYAVLLYKKFLDQGIAKKTWKDGARNWWRLLRQIPQLLRRRTRARWVRQFGMAVGRLKGSIKYRVVAL